SKQEKSSFSCLLLPDIENPRNRPATKWWNASRQKSIFGERKFLKTIRISGKKIKTQMVDITHKNHTLRTAVAQAIVKVSRQETVDAVKNKTVPKGDVFEMAKTAGLFAAKKTSDMIPDCHPLPVEYTGISYEINGFEIEIKVEIKTIYKTGVEVEAMHAASVVALTMYDMLKPIDSRIEIRQIKLLEKKGGKSEKADRFEHPIKTAVIVCSVSSSTDNIIVQSGRYIKK